MWVIGPGRLLLIRGYYSKDLKEAIIVSHGTVWRKNVLVQGAASMSNLRKECESEK